MPLVSESIPNLINGVSQQPPSLRLKTQAELQENALSTVVDGLRKRPCTEYVQKIMNSGEADDAFIHTIRRDENEFYILVITSNSIKVFDKNGQPKLVTGNASYLSGLTNPSTEITATSVADYTFIVNKNTVVTKASTTSPSRPAEAMMYVKQGDYLTDYTLKITYGGTTQTYTYTTPDSSVASNQASVKTNHIASQIYNQLSNLPSYFVRENFGSSFYLATNDGSDFSIEATDSRGDTFFRAFKGQTTDFLDLPPKGKLGFTIKVIGDGTDQEDDYYVSLQDPEGNGTYVWRETIAPDLETQFDKATMPHQLVKQTDGSFVFQEAPWEDRTAGEDLTNPFPSFVDHQINDIFLHRNRLGFLSDENVIFSEAGEYYNFFARTVLTILDSNPIDVAVSNNQVSILKHAVPFNRSLLLFSDLTQFELTAQDTLTPDSVSIDVATQFEASLRAKPQGAGRFVFFPVRRGTWSGVREYFVEDSTETTNNALEVTAHVPQYIDGEVRKLAASSNEEMLVALTDNQPSKMFVYRYYWSASEKLQSSWSTWTFDGDILNVDFNMSDIYVVIERSDGIFLEVINLSRDTAMAYTSGGFPVHLDRRVKLESGGTETLPYTDANAIYVTAGGSILDKDDANFSTILSNALSEGVVYAGVPYTFKYRFSEFVVKKQNEPVTTGRVQLRNLTVVFNDTGFFEAVITPDNRDATTAQFTGRIVGAANNQIGKVSIESGNFRIPVLAESSKVSVELQSDSFLPCVFQSAEWEGVFNLRNRRDVF